MGGTGGTDGTGGTGGPTLPRATWTALYNTIFGPNGTSNCALAGGCHTTGSMGFFICGSSKATCYDGMVTYGLVIPGEDALESRLIDPMSSPLCDVSDKGRMPKDAKANGLKCVSSSQIERIREWLEDGAPEN